MMQIEVLDPLTSNIKDSITRATELLLFTSMVPLSTKMVFLTQEISEMQAIFLQAVNSIHNAKQDARPSCF
jgi:hypothetical protein